MSKRRIHIFKAMPDASGVHIPGNGSRPVKRKGRFKKMVHKKGEE